MEISAFHLKMQTRGFEYKILSFDRWGVHLELMTFYLGETSLLVKTVCLLVLLSLTPVIADLLQLYSHSDDEISLFLGFAFLGKEEWPATRQGTSVSMPA